MATEEHISIPQLKADHIDLADDTDHIKDVNRLLQANGAVQVQLEFDDDECRYLERLIISLHRNHGHGLPIDHSASRGWFWDIRPNLSQKAAGEHRARSETAQVFPWHTDCSYESSPPRYFALQVLHADHMGGGVLSILPVEGLRRNLTESSADALSAAEYRIEVPPEFSKRQDCQEITGRVMAVTEAGEHQLRFRGDIITPLTPRAAVAVEELKSVLTKSTIMREVLNLTPQLLPRGSIVLVDNRRWLHARSEVKDPRRHLRRVRWDACPFS